MSWWRKPALPIEFSDIDACCTTMLPEGAPRLYGRAVSRKLRQEECRIRNRAQWADDPRLCIISASRRPLSRTGAGAKFMAFRCYLPWERIRSLRHPCTQFLFCKGRSWPVNFFDRPRFILVLTWPALRYCELPRVAPDRARSGFACGSMATRHGFRRW
jgi:hypothetical protein